MKKLGYFVSIILLLGAMALCSNANAGLTASQPPQINGFVRETIPLTVTLGNNGDLAILATVTPIVPSGVGTDMPFGQPVELGPGITRPISYNLWAEQVGTYPIRSQINYDEGGRENSLYLESDFTVIDQPAMPQEYRNSAMNQLYPNNELDLKTIGDRSFLGTRPAIVQEPRNSGVNQLYPNNELDLKTIGDKSFLGTRPAMSQEPKNSAVNQLHSNNGRDVKTTNDKSSHGKNPAPIPET